MSDFNCRIRNIAALPLPEWTKAQKIPDHVPDTQNGQLTFQVGEIVVDTGTIGIVDPCYAGLFQHFGLYFGVPGDGRYPVFAVYKDGLLVEVRIPIEPGWE